ncbi:MAG: MarR family transcriptional regulator [Eubacterium sp.]|nr:MarR family transcriptional regulator [Eubacterium sp.]
MEYDKELHARFFAVLDAFRHVEIWKLTPELNHGETHCMKAISNCMGKSGGESVRVSDIVKVSEMPAPAVSRMLGRLEERGLITRSFDPCDRRNTLVEFTERGRSVFREADDTLNQFAHSVLSKMDEEKVVAIIEGMTEFMEISRNEIAQRCGCDRKEAAK